MAIPAIPGGLTGAGLGPGGADATVTVKPTTAPPVVPPTPAVTPKPSPKDEVTVAPITPKSTTTLPKKQTPAPAKPKVTADPLPPATQAPTPVIVPPPPAIPASELCPTCHSRIGADSLTESGRTRGAQGVDSGGNPVPFWSDDPIFTPNGTLNGEAYKNQQRVQATHIKELQEYRQQKEVESGISPTTVFSVVVRGNKVHRRHIIELRESTEKILAASGLTLEDYFKVDPNGAEAAQNPQLVNYGAANPQAEWIDVNRGEAYINKDGQLTSTFVLPNGNTEDSPTLPSKTRIRGIHIEDLRHPLVIAVFDSFFHTPNVTGTSGIDPGN